MGKAFVIASTTWLEIVRRPLFWLLFVLSSVLLVLCDVLPYFTFGEDIKMVKDLGLALITVSGLLVVLFAASVSISEEIDGKTAITLLSKPITRRDFILGKYIGIMAAVALLFALLSIDFAACLWYKAGYEAKENALDPPTNAERVQLILRMAPGVVLSFFQVMVVGALSVALSTRFPVHMNIPACVSVYLLGHLSQQMVLASEQRGPDAAASLVTFMAKLFATVLPGLEYFNVGPAIATDAVVPWVGYVLPCLGYCLLYTAFELVLALWLFEDRDLA